MGCGAQQLGLVSGIRGHSLRRGSGYIIELLFERANLFRNGPQDELVERNPLPGSPLLGFLL